MRDAIINILPKKKASRQNPQSLIIFYGAEGRNRTDMGLLPLDFESSASTNFTTPAISGNIL